MKTCVYSISIWFWRNTVYSWKYHNMFSYQHHCFEFQKFVIADIWNWCIAIQQSSSRINDFLKEQDRDQQLELLANVHRNFEETLHSSLFIASTSSLLYSAWFVNTTLKTADYADRALHTAFSSRYDGSFFSLQTCVLHRSHCVCVKALLVPFICFLLVHDCFELSSLFIV